MTIFIALGVATLLAVSFHLAVGSVLPSMQAKPLTAMGLFWFSCAGVLRTNAFNLNTFLTGWLNSIA